MATMTHVAAAEVLRDPDALAAAVAALRTDGVVVLDEAVNLAHVEILRERAFADLALFQARKDAPYNWNKGNVQQDPAPFPPYLFRDVMANDAAIAVTHAILGEGVANAFYSGNTAVKSESRQPVHADTGQLWPNLETAHPPVQIVINLPLVDFSPENGSTEIWPGTHLLPEICIQDGDIEIPSEALERRRAVSPPLQPVVQAGSLVLRDIRLWHAGMPNRTDVPRPMIAMIHGVSWWPMGNLKFPKGTEAIFDHPVLRTRAEFVDGPIDHIAAPSAYAYSGDEA